jgi:hypothetical protein
MNNETLISVVDVANEGDASRGVRLVFIAL